MPEYAVDLLGALIIGVAIVGYMNGTPTALTWRRRRQLHRQCDALLARTPQRLGVLFPIDAHEVPAAMWGARHGRIGVLRSCGRWVIYRKVQVNWLRPH